MNNQQHPKQQNRPSLYEPQGTTSAFSILSAAQPLGWSKKKSIGLSIISFIAGGVFCGGAVELIKSADEPSSQLTELATSKPAYEKSLNTIESSSKQIAQLPIAHQTLDVQMKKSIPLSNQPVNRDPLASFKNETTKKTELSKPNIQKNFNSNTLNRNLLAIKDDAQLQKLIERKTNHDVIAESLKEKNKQLEKTRAEKQHLEQSKFVSVTLAQKDRLKTEKINASSRGIVRSNKPLAHDKDVLLVKSMLDTMDHPLTVNITTRTKSIDGSN
jgi:hypothetical protein